MGNVAALIATIAKLEPIIVEAVKLLQAAVPPGALADFVTKVEDLANQLKSAIDQHKSSQ